MVCEYCGKEVGSEALTYKGKHFCRNNNDQCLKEYLFDENDEEIGLEYMQTDNSYPEDRKREERTWMYEI